MKGMKDVKLPVRQPIQSRYGEKGGADVVRPPASRAISAFFFPICRDLIDTAPY